jgi:hypothetical protein
MNSFFDQLGIAPEWLGVNNLFVFKKICSIQTLRVTIKPQDYSEENLSKSLITMRKATLFVCKLNSSIDGEVGFVKTQQ